MTQNSVANDNNFFLFSKLVWLIFAPQSGASIGQTGDDSNGIAGALGATSKMTFSLTSLVTWWRRLGGWAQPGLWLECLPVAFPTRQTWTSQISYMVAWCTVSNGLLWRSLGSLMSSLLPWSLGLSSHKSPSFKGRGTQTVSRRNVKKFQALF